MKNTTFSNQNNLKVYIKKEDEVKISKYNFPIKSAVGEGSLYDLLAISANRLPKLFAQLLS